MKDNVYLDLAFMIFSLGFFTWGMWLVHHHSNVTYERMLNERREFGYREPPEFIDTRQKRRRRS